MTNEAYKDELNAAAERKQGQSRLVYDKTKRTIVTEDADARAIPPNSAEPLVTCPDCGARAGMPHNINCEAWPGRQAEVKAERELAAALSPSPLHAMLDERGSRYGKFVDHARVTQAMKAIVYDELRRGDKRLMPDQIEALDMITHAIGRIVAGNADHKEPWIDISIYATLVADRLKGEER